MRLMISLVDHILMEKQSVKIWMSSVMSGRLSLDILDLSLDILVDPYATAKG